MITLCSVSLCLAAFITGACTPVRATYFSPLSPYLIIITGIFNPLSHNKTAGYYENKDQKYLRAAFEMAIDEVNSDADLLQVVAGGYKAKLLSNAVFNMGDMIRPKSNGNDAFDAGVMSYEALVTCETYMDSKQPSLTSSSLSAIRGGIIQAISSEISTLSLVNINSNWNEPVYIANGRSTYFSDGFFFDKHVNIMPSYIVDADAILDVLRYYDWKRVAVIYDSNNMGIHLKYQLDLMKGSEITYLFVGEFFVSSYKSLVDDAKASGARIFVLLLTTEDAAMFLEEGYKRGALRQGTQAIVCSAVMADELAELISTDVSSVLEGVLTLELYPKYGLYSTASGQRFLKNFKALPSTLDAQKRSLHPSNPELYCNMSKDSLLEDYKYYYNYSTSTDRYSYEYCFGVADFSVLEDADIPAEALFVYDAVYAIARTADKMIRAGLSFSSSRDIFNYIMDGNNTIALSSGNATVKMSQPSVNDFAKGERTAGNHYLLRNYNSRHGNFSYVGLLTDGDLFLCADKASALKSGISDPLFSACHNPSYRTEDDTTAPRDIWPSDYVYLSASAVGIIMAFSVLLLVLTVCLIVFIRVYEKQKPIHSAAPGTLYIILVGILICSIKCILNAYEGEDAIYCHLDMWLGHISYRFVISTLGQKCWRVDKIINSGSFKRVKVTAMDTMMRVASLLLLSLVLLSICEIFGSLDGNSNVFDTYTYDSIVMNHHIVHPVCTSHFGDPRAEELSNVGDIVYAILLFMQATTTVTAFYYCWRTRDVPSIVNESKPITYILVVTSTVAIVSGIFTFEAGMMADSEARQVLIAFTFLIPGYSCLYLYFLPKVLKTLADVRKESEESNSDGLRKKHRGLGSIEDSVVSEEEMTLIMGKLQDHRGYEERVRVCHEEIGKLNQMHNAWLVVMMTLSDSSTGPKNSSVYTIESLDSDTGGGSKSTHFGFLPGVAEATTDDAAAVIN